MESQTIRLAEFGLTFATREEAKKVVDEARGGVVSRAPKIIVDFSGIRLVSYSFADELIKQLLIILENSGAHEVLLSNCNEDVLTVFTGTVEKRGRLADSGLTTDSRPDSLAIIGTA